MCPHAERLEAWNRVVRDLPSDRLESISHTISLSDVSELAPRILAGEVRGRVVIDVRR
jgi:acrylyl-CoA reductase (NADPH)